jgi:hypothetical protein
MTIKLSISGLSYYTHALFVLSHPDLRKGQQLICFVMEDRY